MKRVVSVGKCRVCGRVFSKTAMSRHIQACAAKTPAVEPAPVGHKQKGGPFIHLVVEGQHAREYWLHLAVRRDATLGDLDSVLRAIWLECCGHLSAFKINGIQHDSDESGFAVAGFGDDETSSEGGGMGARISQVLPPGTEFTYQYDFGSTTALKGRAVGLLPKGRKEIDVLARNDPPNIACSACGQPATDLCSECQYSGGGRLCAGCAKKHPCGEEMLLPLINSPRAGVCGYCGPSREP